ncbi:HD domain-containing protein [Lactococcus nasutitermitis]|uniref:HD domain-containing protein n=1 Tax=Lactococcus nasutitermitis TaxID=1652957 RepID=A0ABV9JC36_9LACT|nr:HD domain-containing protein [Lactococcus nasutitermitis]
MNLDNEPWFRDAEYMSYVGHFLEMPELKKLDSIVHHYTSTRLQHCLKVSYMSYVIAKKHGLNAKATARAGLFHDLFYYDWRDTKFTKSHAYVHPRIAYRNACKLTTISPLEKDIIIKHMWGATLAPPRYKESFIVTFVDDYVAMQEGKTTAKFKWNRRKHLKRLPYFTS